MPFSITHNAHVLLQPVRNTSPLVCSHTNCFNKKEQTQNWNGLKFIRCNKLLKDLSTWGIGGPCNYFVQVFDQSQLVSAIRYCHEHSVRYVVIGIPGTVGGAVYMNAGANGQETAGVIDSVDIVTLGGKLQRVSRNDLKFGYRSSSFQDMKDLAAIVAVTFQLQESTSARRKQRGYLERRRMTQPLGERTAGSVFRNPSDKEVAAAELIERAGLKGFRVGGAMVSNIHANFFVNTGGSTSRDMLNLIAFVKEKVDQKFGVQLKEEVQYFHPQ
ncbi:hypothetical protein AB3S75_031924 [Citrus x aurantiifolia]